MNNRLEAISRRVTTKYREVTGDPFNAALDDLDYLFSVIDANYNAGLEAAARLEFVKAVPIPAKSTWDVSIGPYGICNDIKSEQHAKEIATPLNHAIATAIRALSVDGNNR
jgi:hypothetical protein